MEDEYVFCPYNKAHRMLRKRLIPHMIKCKVLYPDVELKACPFNQAHLVTESEFVKHTTTCPDRKLITQYKYSECVKEEDDDKPPKKEIQCDDNWDDEVVEDYNPKKNVQPTNILRQPDFLFPSERRLQLKEEETNFEEANELSRPKINDPFYAEQKLKNIKKESQSHKVNSEKNKSKRPLTPPPPTGIDWQAKPCTTVFKRERSRSPI